MLNETERLAVERNLKVNAAENERKRLAHKLYDKCSLDEAGNLIRGMVSKVKCPACGNMRWDDGTKCVNCRARFDAQLGEDNIG